MAELLHWVTRVTRLVDLLVKVPLPPGHGPRVHLRVTVVVEPVLAPLIVLTTVTVQVNPVVAPVGLPLRPLHWLTPMVAALAEEGGRTIPAVDNAPMPTARAITIVRSVSRRGEAWVWDISVVFI